MMIRFLKICALLLMLAWAEGLIAAGGDVDFVWEGRLTGPSGEPYSGRVSLRLAFFHSPDDPNPVASFSQGLDNVPLEEGVFQIRIPIPAAQYHRIFPDIGQEVFVQLTDLTHADAAPFPRQRLSVLPYAGKVPVDGVTLQFDSTGHLKVISVPQDAVLGLAASLTRKMELGESSLELPPYGTTTGATRTLRFRELGNNGSEFVGLKAPDSIASSLTWVLPASAGLPGQVLTTDGNGALQWVGAPEPTGTAGGDLSGFFPNPSVSSVGGASGKTAADIVAGISAVQAASAANTPLAIVKRDLNGGFSTGSVTVTASNPASQALIVRGTTGQISALQEWRDGADSLLSAIDSSGGLRLKAGATTFATLRANPFTASDVTYTLPASPGPGQYLTTDANGQLSWAAPSLGGGIGIVGITNGGTGASTAPGARSNLGAAASGANTDITSLSNLTSLTTSGNVGVATSSPAATLDVQGSGGVILNAGNVGIGTSNPTALLSVNSSGTNVSINNPSSGQGLILAGAGAGTTGQLRIVANDAAWADGQTTAYFQIQTGNNRNASFMGGTFNTDALFDRLQFNSNFTSIADNNYGSTPVPTALFELINNTAAKSVLKIRGAPSQSSDIVSVQNASGSVLLNIKADGNVGIGTTSPSALLSLGSSAGTQALALYDQPGDFYGFGMAAGRMIVQTAGEEKMTVTNTGNIGIGLAEPTAKLMVQGVIASVDTGSPGIGTYLLPYIDQSYITGIGSNLTHDGATWKTYDDSNSDNGASAILTDHSGTMTFHTIPSNKTLAGSHRTINELDLRETYMRIMIDAGGNVGIGKFAPKSRLDVSGDITVADKIIHSGDTNTTIRFPFVDTITANTNGQERLRITPDGNIGIGTSSPTQKLHLVGNLLVEGSGGTCVIGDSAGAISCLSDIRLKDNIQPLPHILEKISLLRGVEFDWNDRSPSAGKHAIGVIAQEVEKVFPTAVVTDEHSGYKMVDYAVLVAPLVEGIKALHAENLKLREENTMIKSELSELRSDSEITKSKAQTIENQLNRLLELLCKSEGRAEYCN